ncbi:VOC family protein [Sporolactobacillus shoreae]|uniref:VOC family protein n=1 Tax=Sporolactobacillus shoreae TaxID=1465501 RepID=A0A4Z0GJ35_9BACL|nr:VOC family protein [Sporolactobacillus shoreae]TGA95824.1 VOC family protein [Sporolactobacillus shoreae]
MDLKMILNSMYLCVKDMDRAINFYEQLLDQKVSEKDEIFSIFNFEHNRLCLFNPSKVNEKHVWGNNCLPSFQVNNMDLLLNRIDELGAPIVFPLTKIGESLVLEFKDTEGNDIEVYCKQTNE